MLIPGPVVSCAFTEPFVLRCCLHRTKYTFSHGIKQIFKRILISVSSFCPTVRYISILCVTPSIDCLNKHENLHIKSHRVRTRIILNALVSLIYTVVEKCSILHLFRPKNYILRHIVHTCPPISNLPSMTSQERASAKTQAYYNHKSTSYLISSISLVYYILLKI